MNTQTKQETFEKIFKEHLKIETYSKSIDSLLGPRLKNKINYKPYYQRNYVWDNNKATYFIESILLGTEIPPLIFFDNNTEIEIIDGRQRFETILRFVENKFQLTAKGLYTLKSLKKKSYDDLAKESRQIIDNFLDFKLRIIEFKLVNEPPLDKSLEDRVKKEIFSRYNSGITPLKKSEIDNATYDKDNLSNQFKEYLEKNNKYKVLIYNTFFNSSEKIADNPNIETIMPFVRRALIMPLFPINYFSQSTDRTTISSKLYDYYADLNFDDEDEVIKVFLTKVEFLSKVREHSLRLNKQVNWLALECFLWGLGVLELEEKSIEFSESLIEEISDFIDKNIDSYPTREYAFSQEIVGRYKKTADFFSERFQIDTTVYVIADNENKQRIRKLIKPTDTLSKQEELQSLRINKPEPARNSIEDVCRIMGRRKFLVRPSYQRKEVVNQLKSSSIIESILLGITLPAIFVFKKTDGLSEVIDGQQRILTLLGFIGSEYINEKNEREYSKNFKFKLRNLRILKDLNGHTFEKLNDSLKNKILDFQLYIVEIDEIQNPNFDPIDLFIRLNDKPYPIREHSFEMWNSWVSNDIIQDIKQVTQKIKPWFYLKQLRTENDRDRMENEEMLTSLTFLEYNRAIKNHRPMLYIYQNKERINSRVVNKALISSLLQQISEEEDAKNSKEVWESALKSLKSFINKLKIILLDQHKNENELFSYLKTELDEIFKAEKKTRYFRRTMQDFYLIWYLIADINMDMVKFRRLEIKEDLRNIFKYIKDMPESDWYNNIGFKNFEKLASDFKTKYSIDNRKIKLTEKEKRLLLEKQGNVSSISGAPIFEGDEIEVDHDFPLAKGGLDAHDNLRIVHKDENRKKGSKLKNTQSESLFSDEE